MPLHIFKSGTHTDMRDASLFNGPRDFVNSKFGLEEAGNVCRHGGWTLYAMRLNAPVIRYNNMSGGRFNI